MTASAITDGIRLTVNVQSGQAYQCTAIFFGGTNFSASYLARDSNISTSQTYTTGFEADLVFFTSVYDETANGSLPKKINNNNRLSFGAAYNDGVGGVTQRGLRWAQIEGVTSDHEMLYRNDSVIFTGSSTASAGSFTSSGYTLTATSDFVGDNNYLAIKWTTPPSIDILDISIPTSGDYAQTDASAQPQFGLMVMGNGITAVNTAATTNTAALHIAAFTDDDLGAQTSSA